LRFNSINLQESVFETYQYMVYVGMSAWSPMAQLKKTPHSFISYECKNL